jgi:hypothetical protein
MKAGLLPDSLYAALSTSSSASFSVKLRWLAGFTALAKFNTLFEATGSMYFAAKKPAPFVSKVEA